MTKEPTHLAAGNEPKAGALPGGIVSETCPGKVHQLVIGLRDENASQGVAACPKGFWTVAKSPSKLEDDVGLFEIYAVEKSGALTDWIVWVVVGNAVRRSKTERRIGWSAFPFERHHTRFTARERPLLHTFGTLPRDRFQNSG